MKIIHVNYKYYEFYFIINGIIIQLRIVKISAKGHRPGLEPRYTEKMNG